MTVAASASGRGAIPNRGCHAGNGCTTEGDRCVRPPVNVPRITYSFGNDMAVAASHRTAELAAAQVRLVRANSNACRIIAARNVSGRRGIAR